jgi:hypothetical protein
MYTTVEQKSTIIITQRITTSRTTEIIVNAFSNIFPITSESLLIAQINCAGVSVSTPPILMALKQRIPGRKRLIDDKPALFSFRNHLIMKRLKDLRSGAVNIRLILATFRTKIIPMLTFSYGQIHTGLRPSFTYILSRHITIITLSIYLTRISRPRNTPIIFADK